MGARFKEIVEKSLGWLIFAIIVVIGLTILVPILLLTTIAAILASIPLVLGNRISVEDAVASGLDKLIGVDTMRGVRDDLIMVFYPFLELGNVEEIDRLYLHLMIESGHESTVHRLQEGETLFAFLGGIASVLIISTPTHNILLTIILLLLTLIVTVRVAATDILSFPHPVADHYSKTDLQLMAAWNYGPIRERGVIQMVVLTLMISLFADRGSARYDQAMKVLSWGVALRTGANYHRWHDTSQNNG